MPASEATSGKHAPGRWSEGLRWAALAAAGAVILLQVVSIFLPSAAPPALKFAALLFYFLAAAPNLRPVGMVFAVGTVAIVLLEGPAGVAAALDAGLFLATLVLALTMMAAGAARSPDTATVSQALMSRPVSRIYLPLTLASHVFSLALNVGSIAIFMTLLRVRRQQLLESGQLRPLALAVMRGFSGMPMWAPFSVSMGLTLSMIPSLHYAELAPFGVAMAVLALTAGWLMDGRGGGGESAPLGARANWAIALMLLRLAALVAVAWLLEWSLAIRFIEGIVLSAIVGGSLWWLSSLTAARNAQSRRSIAAPAAGPSNEIVIMTAAAFLGKWVSATVAGHLDLGSLSDTASAFVVAAVPLGMLVLGFIGSNPIVSGSLLGGLVLPLTPEGHHLHLGLALLAGWGAASSGSPFTGSVLLACRMIEVPVLRFTLRWNGAYSFGVALVAAAGLLLAQLLD